MSDIEDYRAFVAVIERKSLTAAARQLGRSLQSMSRSLASLERELGVELVRRTTRSSRATDAGLAFRARIKAALADIDLARSEITESAALLTGRLRVGRWSCSRPPTSSPPRLISCRAIRRSKSHSYCRSSTRIQLPRGSISPYALDL